jgi:hypothetical protein
MSPTIFRERGYRFFFFSLEEARMHVHVRSGRREAKFWLEPAAVLAKNYGYSQHEPGQIQEIIEARRDELTVAWHRHFDH